MQHQVLPVSVSNKQLRIPIFGLEIDLPASFIRNMDLILIIGTSYSHDISDSISQRPDGTFAYHYIDSGYISGDHAAVRFYTPDLC